LTPEVSDPANPVARLVRKRVGVRHVLRKWLGVDRAIAFTGIRFTHIVLDPFALALSFINVAIKVVLFSQTTDLRAHKQETFLLVLPVVTGSVLTNVILGWPLGTCVFAQYRRLWHAQ
jgi:hypothetical protein